MKKIILIVGFALILIIAIFVIARLTTDKDTWICENGQWQKHGNPVAPMPSEPCGEKPSPEIPEIMKIKVFFNNEKLDPEFSCYRVFPVEKLVLKTKAVARAAMEELLKGPSEENLANGYFTSINSGVKIQSLTITDGVAKIDFNEQLEFQVGGSCRVAAISSQIRETLKQFSTVKEVIISINGRTEDILQP